MYAVIRSGGKQYRVTPGQTIRLEKLTGDAGAKIELDNIIFLENGGEVKVGSAISGVKIEATILETDRANKILVFKKKRKKQYRRTRGHRQSFTTVRIEKFLE